RRLRKADPGSVQPDQRQAGLLPRVLLGTPRAAGLLAYSSGGPCGPPSPGFHRLCEAPALPGFFLLSSRRSNLTLSVLSPIASRRELALEASIGNTPTVELSRFSRGSARIFAKLEWFNPGGSLKDRIGRSMIADAERRGLLKPGGTIVEPTSGNTGVALAMLAAVKGYRCVVVMPEGYGHVKARLMEGFGATIVRTPSDRLMTGAIERAKAITAETPGAFMPNQFANPINPRTHYE